MTKLLTSSVKTDKSIKYGYLNAIVYMNPAEYPEICPNSTPECREFCLNTAGRGAFSNVQEARAKRTKWFFENRERFIAQLDKEIAALVKKANKLRLKLAVRLNGTSDLPWHKLARGLFAKYPSVQFYDYTKVAHYWIRAQGIANYDVTFSASELNYKDQVNILKNGGRVAMVVNDKTGVDYDGDQHDLMFLHGSGIVGLTPKGKAKKATISGFVNQSAIIPVLNVA